MSPTRPRSGRSAAPPDRAPPPHRGATLDQQTEQPTRPVAPLAIGLAGTLFVLLGVVALLVGLGLLGLVLAALVAIGVTAAAHLAGPRLALRSTGAVAADPHQHARYDNLVEGLSVSVGVAKPQLFVLDVDSANAFACGRDQRDAAIVVTRGLLERASRIELEGLLARQLQQIKSGDVAHGSRLTGLLALPAAASDRALRYFGGSTLPRSPGRTVGSALCWPLAPLAPLFARLYTSYLPKQRVEAADLAAVEVTRYPPGLAGALEQVRAAGSAVPAAGRLTAHLWVAQPMPAPPAGDSFATRTLVRFDVYPPIDHRIDALREL